MTRKESIPRIIVLLVSLLVVLIGFYAWHDRSLLSRERHTQQEVFVLNNQPGAFKSSLQQACYPLWVLRPAYFNIPDQWQELGVMRYRSTEEMQSLQQMSGGYEPGLEMIVISGKTGRAAIHRLAIIDLKFTFTVLVALVFLLALELAVRQPLRRT